MRIIFMGSPEFSVNILKTLHSQHEIVAVYTQPPKPAGRGYKQTPCAVHKAANELGLKTYTPSSLKNKEVQQQFRSHNAHIAIIVAYGMILPKEILNILPNKFINIHASILPRWRGAAPIQRAIEAGDKETGITYMQMDEGLDTGDILKKIRIPIFPFETAGSLHDKLSRLGSENMNQLLNDLDNITPKKQPDNGITYAHKLSKDESLINWEDSAENIERRLRAFTPWPGLFINYQDTRIRILKAELVSSQHHKPAGTVLDNQLLIACSKNALRITYLQKSGKKAMDASAFLLGTPITVNNKL